MLNKLEKQSFLSSRYFGKLGRSSRRPRHTYSFQAVPEISTVLASIDVGAVSVRRPTSSHFPSSRRSTAYPANFSVNEFCLIKYSANPTLSKSVKGVEPSDSRPTMLGITYWLMTFKNRFIFPPLYMTVAASWAENYSKQKAIRRKDANSWKESSARIPPDNTSTTHHVHASLVNNRQRLGARERPEQ